MILMKASGEFRQKPWLSLPFTQGGKQQEARSKGGGVKSEGGKGDKGGREIRGEGARGGGGGEGQRWGVSLSKNLTHYLQVYPSWNTIQSKTGPVSE